MNRIILVGGGARSEAVRHIAPALWGAPVHVPTPAEYVALGPPGRPHGRSRRMIRHRHWSFGITTTYTADPTPHVLDQYRAAQPLTLGQ